MRRTIRLAGQVCHNLSHNLRYVVNDDYYWDRYVKNLEDSGQAQRLEVLGAEWGNEETFLSMLERLGSSDRVALEIGCGGGRVTRRGVEIFRHVHASRSASPPSSPGRRAFSSRRRSISPATTST
jgi:hypothetical protein